MPRRKRRSRLLGALILLILLGLLLPLGSLLTGFLPGGKSRAEAVPEPEPRHSPGSLEVTVVSATDLAPIEGARVLVERLTGGESETESDARGRVRLSGLGAGPVRLEARVGGRKAEAWTDPALTHEVRLAVGPEPRRSGRVTPGPARVSLLDDDGREVAACETDAQGRYDLPDLEGSLCAVAQAFAPAVAQGGDLVLREGTLVQGKLIGGGAGALAVFGLVASGVDEMLPFRAEWRVEADGSFRGRLPVGAEAFGIFRGLPVRIVSGEIALPAPARAAGVVRREDGTPAARAVLLFRPLLDGDFAPPLPGLRVEADLSGEFVATGFAAGRYSVEAYAPGCATRIVPDVEVGREAIEIVLAGGFSIEGFIVDAAGLPVPGARVRALGLPEESDRPVLSGAADSLGRFRLAGLGGTHARLRVTAPGYHATTLDRLAPSSTLRVVLQTNG